MGCKGAGKHIGFHLIYVKFEVAMRSSSGKARIWGEHCAGDGHGGITV